MQKGGGGLIIRIQGFVEKKLITDLKTLQERLASFADAAGAAGQGKFAAGIENSAQGLHETAQAATQALSNFSDEVKSHFGEAGDAADSFVDKAGRAGEAHKFLSGALEVFENYAIGVSEGLSNITKELDDYQKNSLQKFIDLKAGMAQLGGDTAKVTEQISRKISQMSAEGLGEQSVEGLRIYKEALEAFQKELGDSEAAQEQAKIKARELADQVLRTANALEAKGAEGAMDWAKSLDYASVQSALLKENVARTADGIIPLTREGLKQIGLWGRWTEAVRSVQADNSSFIKQLNRLKEAQQNGSASAQGFREDTSRLSQQLGSANSVASAYILQLGLVSDGLDALGRKAINLGDSDLQRVVTGVDRTQVVLEALKGNLIASKDGFQILNREGIIPFAELTKAQVSSLGLLGETFQSVKGDVVNWSKEMEKLKSQGVDSSMIERIQHLGEAYGLLPERIGVYLASATEAETKLNELYREKLQKLNSIENTGSKAYKKLETEAESLISPSTRLNEAFSVFEHRMGQMAPVLDKFAIKLQSMGASHDIVEAAVKDLTAEMLKGTTQGFATYDALADKVVKSVESQVRALAESSSMLEKQQAEYTKSEAVAERFEDGIRSLVARLKQVAEEGKVVTSTLTALSSKAAEFGKGADKAEDSYKEFGITLNLFQTISEKLNSSFDSVIQGLEHLVAENKEAQAEIEQDLKASGDRQAAIVKKNAEKVKKSGGGVGLLAGGGSGDDGDEKDSKDRLNLYNESFGNMSVLMGKSVDESNEAKRAANEYTQALLRMNTVLYRAGVPTLKDWASNIQEATILNGMLSGELEIQRSMFVPLSQAMGKKLNLDEKQVEVLQDSVKALQYYEKAERQWSEEAERGNTIAQAKLRALKYLKGYYEKVGEGIENDYVKRLGDASKATQMLKKDAARLQGTEFAELAGQVKLASAAIHLMDDNLRIVKGRFQIINEKGLSPFKSLTLDQVKALKLLHPTFEKTLSHLREWDEEISIIRSKGLMNERDIKILEMVGAAFSHNIGSIAAFRKAVKDASDEANASYNLQTIALGRMEDKGSETYQTLAAAAEKLKDPNEIAAKAISLVEERAQKQQKAVEGLEGSLESLTNKSAEVRQAVRMLAQALGVEGGVAFDKLKSAAGKAAKTLEDGVTDQRLWISEARKMVQSGALTEAQMESLRAEISRVEADIREATSAQSIFARTMKMLESAASHHVDEFKEIDKAYKTAAANGNMYADLLTRLRPKYQDTVSVVKELARLISSHSKAVATDTIKLQNRIIKQKEDIAAAKKRGESIDALVKDLADLEKRYDKISTSAKQLEEVEKRVVGAFNESALASAKGAKTLSKWDAALDKAKEKSYGHWAALKKLGEIYGENALKVEHYNKAIGIAHANIQNVIDGHQSEITALQLKRDALVADRKETEKLDKQLEFLNAEMRRLRKEANIVEAAMEQYREQVDRTYRSQNRFTTGAIAAQKETGKLNTAFKAVGRRLYQFAAFSTAAASLYSFIHAVRVFVRATSDLDQTLYSLQAVAEFTVPQVALVKDAIIEAANAGRYGSKEIGAAFQRVGQAGFDMAESMNMMKATQLLATATLEDMKDVVDLTTSTMRAFQIDTVRAIEVSDIFTNAINKSKLEIGDLRTAFNYVGAAGAQAGLSINEVTGTLMALRDAGLRASTMSTGLRTMLLRLANPSAKLRKAMGELGLTLDDLNPKIGDKGWHKVLENLLPLLYDAETKTVDMGKAARFFEQKAANVISVLGQLVGSKSGRLNQYIEGTKELGGSQRAADLQMQGLIAAFDNLKNRAELLLISLGDAGLTGLLKALIAALGGVANAAREFVTAWPEAVRFTTITTAVYALVTAILFLKDALAKTKAASILFQAMISPAAILAAGIGVLGWAIVELAGRSSRAREESKKLSEQFRMNALAATGWKKALSDALDDNALEYQRMVQRLRHDNRDLYNSFQGSSKILLENITNLDDLNKAWDEYLSLQLKNSIGEDVKVLASLQEQFERIEGADTNKFWKRFSLDIDSLRKMWILLLGEVEGAKFGDWLYGPGEQARLEEMESQITRVRQGVQDMVKAGSLPADKNAIKEWIVENYTILKTYPALLDNVTARLMEDLDDLDAAVKASVEDSKAAWDRLSGNVKEAILEMSTFDAIEFQGRLKDLESDVAKFEDNLKHYTELSTEDRSEILEAYREKRIQEELAAFNRIEEETTQHYTRMQRSVEKHFEDLRDVVNEYHNWEIRQLESADVQEKVISAREAVLNKWESVLSDSYSKARILREAEIDIAADESKMLLDIKEAEANAEFNIRQKVLQVERERSDTMIELANEESRAKIILVKEELKDKLANVWANSKQEEDLRKDASNRIIDIEEATADKKEEVLKSWLGNLQEAYSEAIGKEREYADAIRNVQDQIAEIRKEAAQSVKDNANTTADAILAINRAGMTEQELQKDRLREAQNAQTEGYRLLNKGNLESINQAIQNFEISRDIHKDLGIAAAKGEAAAISEAKALRRVEEAGLAIQAAIERRTQLLVWEKEQERQANEASKQDWADWAVFLGGQIDSVLKDLEAIETFSIGEKYLEIVSNVEEEIKAIQHLDKLGIDDKHYNIIRHEKVIYEGEEGEPPIPGEGRAYDLPSLETMGFASGGDVKAKSPTQQGVDNVPAWLTAGEYVIRKPAVEKYGKSFFDILNRAKLSMQDLPKMAFGGLVGLKDQSLKVIPKFARGGAVPKFRSTMSVVPKFAKGGIVPHFASGGAVGPAGEALYKGIAEIGRMLVSSVESAVEQTSGGVDASLILLGTLQDIYSVTAGGFNELVGIVAELLHAPTQGIQMNELSALVMDNQVIAENTALANQLAASGNSLLEKIDGRLKDLTTLTAKLGRGGDINIQHAVDARKLAFDIQKLQRLGRAPSLG